jgi:hypothetical protein
MGRISWADGEILLASSAERIRDSLIPTPLVLPSPDRRQLGVCGSETAERFTQSVGEHVALLILGAGADEVSTALAGELGSVGEMPVELCKPHV